MFVLVGMITSKSMWLAILLVFFPVLIYGGKKNVNARAWNIDPMRAQQEGDVNDVPWSRYPEASLLEGKDLNGIAMSGGGTRAYMTSLGYLRGLLDLGLLNTTRYLSTVSGGSWANSAFSYYQQDKVGLSEKEFLGEIIGPQQLTRQVLNTMKSKCARNSPVKKDALSMIFWRLILGGYDPVDIFPSTIADVFLKPAGIERSDQVCYSKDVLKDVIARNPHLANDKFVFPRKDRPFPVLNAAVLGPRVAAPFNVKDNDYMPVEFNSLYAGSPQYHLLGFDAVNGATGEKILVNMTVGGFVEPFAFGGHTHLSSTDDELPKPFFGLGPNKYTDMLENIPSPTAPFALANATAASSFAPGSILSGSPLLKALDNDIGLQVEYWSPVTKSNVAPVFSQPIFIADGASLENTGFLSLLRRGLKEAVVFIHSPIPLKPREEYNPFKRQPTTNDVDIQFSCFFGIDHESASVVENLSHNQVFPRYQFPLVIDQMQKAQKRGKGIVVRQELTTVENAYWGIPANHKVNVTWVYLGRCTEWEKQLPKNVQNLVVPKKGGKNPAKLPSSGPFKYFPHFPTSVLHYTTEQANLLANLAGWVIEQNKQLFIQALESKKQSIVHKKNKPQLKNMLRQYKSTF